jgi:hypothetical protein
MDRRSFVPAAAAAQSARPELRLDPGLDYNRLVAAAAAGVPILLAPGPAP